MKKLAHLLFVITFISISISAFSQRSQGGEPLSFQHENLNDNINRVVISPPDLQQIIMEDQQRQEKGELYRIGVVLDANINFFNEASFDELEDGTKIWRLKLSSKGAKSITLLYEDFFIPQGGELFLYNENRKHVKGAFDFSNNPLHSTRYSTEMIQGENTYIEYIQKTPSEELPKIIIGSIVYNYRSVDRIVARYSDNREPDFGASGSCNVNINCPEGNNWQTVKKGVAEIFVIDGVSAGFCSGTLVNNTSNDGTPYFLTADHCGGTSSTMDQWQFYFHYEAAGCTQPATEPSYETIIGSQLRARGPENGGSDFLLLELSMTVDDAADLGLYYNGWDRSGTASNSGVGIHHPSGDIKKISKYNATLQAADYPGGMNGAYWQLTWVATATNHSVTEQGSSGSPLFDETSQQIVGTLTGGAASCTNLTGPDLYGMFSVHWEDNGTNNNQRLKPWLDPSNTNEEQIDGFDPNNANPGNPPVADFSGTPVTVTVGGNVQFTDNSTNNPTSWSWTFQNGTPATSTDQNPNITYNTAGTWNVTLEVSNANGSDTEVKNGYITVVEDGELVANFTATPTNLAAGGNVQFTDESVGDIVSWEWSFPGGTPNSSTDQNPNIQYQNAGAFTVTLEVSDGTESDENVKTDYIIVTGGAGGDLVADFIASSNDIVAGECINFTNVSQGGPTGFSWSFPGAMPTTSTNQNPQNICYPAAGEYDVCLQVTRDSESNTYCCDGCIVVNPDPSNPIVDFVANRTVIPQGGVVQFTNLSENGPYMEWAWTFQGGVPFMSNDSTPPAVAYFEVGEYDVELRGKNYSGVQDIELKEKYIKVIPPATGPPTAKFVANFTNISPGQTVNFIDYSPGRPYFWNWEFDMGGGVVETSIEQNPTGIIYPDEGLYNVRLIVKNNFGSDTLVKEAYIRVSDQDTCTDPPIAKFKADTRLIPAGNTVGFINLSENQPTGFSWEFQNGNPPTSIEENPTSRVRFNNPGIYTVKMSATNNCGADMISKPQYIYVFSGYVSEYCDTLSNIRQDENASPYINSQLGWGFLAGQNGENIKAYADRFENFTFSQIRGFLVPVSYAVNGDYNSSVKFFVWDGQTEKPEVVLAEKRVYIRDLYADQNNFVEFDEPVEIEGPFFVGYSISYPDNNNDGISDDVFVVGIAPPRGAFPENNTLYVQKAGEWQSMVDRYGFASSLAIKPVSCLVDVKSIIGDMNVKVYPNPSKGIINVNIGDLQENDVNIEIFDLLGRKIETDYYRNSAEEYYLNINNQPNGLYIVRISNGQYVVNKKIMLSK